LKKISLAIVLFLISFSAYACRCIPLVSDIHIEGAESIVFGHIVSAEIKVDEKVAIETGRYIGLCDIPMTIGHQWLLFKKKNKNHIGSYGGTRPIGYPSLNKEKQLPFVSDISNHKVKNVQAK
jgi:hypothetical protein